MHVEIDLERTTFHVERGYPELFLFSVPSLEEHYIT